MKRITNHQLFIAPQYGVKDNVLDVLYKEVRGMQTFLFDYFSVLTDTTAIFEGTYLVKMEKKRLAGNLVVRAQLQKTGLLANVMDIEFEEFRHVGD